LLDFIEKKPMPAASAFSFSDEQRATAASFYACLSLKPPLAPGLLLVILRRFLLTAARRLLHPGLLPGGLLGMARRRGSLPRLLYRSRLLCPWFRPHRPLKRAGL